MLLWAKCDPPPPPPLLAPYITLALCFVLKKDFIVLPGLFEKAPTFGSGCLHEALKYVSFFKSPNKHGAQYLRSKKRLSTAGKDLSGFWVQYSLSSPDFLDRFCLNLIQIYRKGQIFISSFRGRSDGHPLFSEIFCQFFVLFLCPLPTVFSELGVTLNQAGKWPPGVSCNP